MHKVTLRTRKIGENKLSLYLDYYPPIIHPTKGKETRREYLKMFLYENPLSREQKNHNKETQMIADKIVIQRSSQLINREYGFKEHVNYNMDFCAYFERKVKEHSNQLSLSQANVWQVAYKYFYDFCGGQLDSNSIDLAFINRYRNHLLQSNGRRGVKNKVLSQNTAATYFKKFLNVLKQAYRDHVVKENFIDQVNYIKEKPTNRDYLSQEELELLWKTPISIPMVKDMAMFSALTGLRFVDIQNLRWDKLFIDNVQGAYIALEERKTHNKFNLNINEQAYKLLLKYKSNNPFVFQGIKYSQIGRPLTQWIKDAGIPKKISFHNFRHTHATLLLANGVDIFTVSKMLGHKNVATTQIYTKVMDRNKIKAVNAIKIDLNGL